MKNHIIPPEDIQAVIDEFNKPDAPKPVSIREKIKGRKFKNVKFDKDTLEKLAEICSKPTQP